MKIDLAQIAHYAEIARNISLAIVAVAGLVFSPKLWAGAKTGWRATAAFFVAVSALPDTLEQTGRRVTSLEETLNERGKTHEQLNLQLAEMARKIQRIDHQVHPNGGRSLNDMVSGITRELSEVRVGQHVMNNVLRVCWDALGAFGVFYCKPDGHNTYCSSVYLKWVGALPSEMEGFGWINYIFHEDRAAVILEWESCAEDERHFHMKYRMVRDGLPFEVEASAQPLRDQAGAVVQWVGMVRKMNRQTDS